MSYNTLQSVKDMEGEILGELYRHALASGGLGCGCTV
jgi:hypothetical protein